MCAASSMTKSIPEGKVVLHISESAPWSFWVAFGIDDILVMREVDFPELNIEGKNAGVAKIAREDPCALPFEHPEFYDIKWTVSYCFEVRLINFIIIIWFSTGICFLFRERGRGE
jgi:hypothetical protein